MPKVLVGISGGVDSAVTAYLLKKAGYDVVGVTLHTWQDDERRREIEDAKLTAKTIDIPHHVLDCTDDFKSKVVDNFIDNYLCGVTPNPCVICNSDVKWERLLHYADTINADFVATGHYASVVPLENGRYTIKKALHAEKDQTYMLYRLSQDQLKRTLMPLYEYSKQEVREIAKKVGIEVASKPDSQEICFVTNGNYADFIKSHSDKEIPDQGNYINESGKILGKHKGIIHYTVGQRKGLGIALGQPAYIKKICPATNEIILSTNDIVCKQIVLKDLNFMSIPHPNTNEVLHAHVKVRYRHSGQNATIKNNSDQSYTVTFDEPVRFAAPGQSAVFYDNNDCIIGGGIISEINFDNH